MTNNPPIPLLPCPFCGGEARFFPCEDPDAFRVMCVKGGKCTASRDEVKPYGYGTAEIAAEAWNKRTQPGIDSTPTGDCREPRGGERFYPEVSKVHAKWIKSACENPMILANPSFETFLAGWQAAHTARPSLQDIVGELKKAEGFPEGYEGDGVIYTSHVLKIINRAFGKEGA